MIPAHIINSKKEQDRNAEIGIQLEIPDYTLEYIEWKRKRDQENEEKDENNGGTVIVIDI